MKITYNWLKDFVDITLPPRQLAEKLTMAGLEVVSIEEKYGDCVFEIEITSNRPDWLSIVGIAREVAALTNKKLRIPKPRTRAKTGEHRNRLHVKIQHKKDCPLYTAKLIEGVRVGPSPGWLKKRLELVGCRSVNSVVDITNYILFEWGEPLHAFDFDRLGGETIIVRRALEGERIITIDGTERILNPEVLVIADTTAPVAVAGIMGGRATEVSETTKAILLEAAVFNPVVIRRGRRVLGLQSESAYRFERGVDSAIAEEASRRAACLIEAVAGGTLSAAKSSKVPLMPVKRVALDAAHVAGALAVKIPVKTTRRILENLGFRVKTASPKKLIAQVPSFRRDVKLEIDLIEEIARIFGYNRIPATIPRIKPQIDSQDDTSATEFLKQILIGLGLNEVITYSLVEKGWLSDKRDVTHNEIAIANPLSKEQAVLRTTLLPSLARCIAYNLRQKQPYVAIFEIAKIYKIDAAAKARENYTLGIALCGARSLWLGKDRAYDEADLLHIKGMLEILFERIGLDKGAYRFIMQSAHEGAVYVHDTLVGTFVKLPKATLDQVDIKNKAVVEAELDVAALLSFAKHQRRFKPFPRLPGVTRDSTIIVNDSIAVDKILDAITQWGAHAAKGLLQGAEISKYYKGAQIPEDAKSLTITCTYCSPERTLTDEEINSLHTHLVRELKTRFDATIR